MKKQYIAGVVLWCGLIFWLSSQSEPPTTSWWLLELPGADKAAHAGVYAILAGLVAIGIRRSNPQLKRLVLFVVPIGFATLYGLTDEIHQIFVPYRTFDLLDLLADALGASIATSFLAVFVWPDRAPAPQGSDDVQLKDTSRAPRYAFSPPQTLRGCGGLFFLMTLAVAAFWGAGMGVFVYILEDAEDTIDALEDFRPKVGSKLYSADGEVLGEYTIETRRLITLNEMPLHLQKAFIATEDHTFYEHKGIRPLAYFSVLAYFFRTSELRGASTITQQIVRNIERTGVSKEVTVQRKLREMLVALQLERKYTKDEILEMYLNQIFLGVSAHGVESAAQQYFMKRAQDITLAEAALLAGLARSPNNNQPFRSPENARKRRDIVLAQMLRNGLITQQDREIALLESVDDSVITPEERREMAVAGRGPLAPNRFKAPYFAEEVRLFVREPEAPFEVDATEQDLYEGGLDVYTTLDLRLQEAAERTLLDALDEFDAKKMRSLERDGLAHEFTPVNGALVCLDNRPGVEGYVRALVGGRNFAERKFNAATQAKRQPGSSVKPFVWLAALDNGMTPSDIVVDERFTQVDMFGNVWEPKNFEDEFFGPMPIRKALEMSVNIVSIKLVDRFKMPLVRSYLRSAGFRLPISDVVGLTVGLGTSETTVLDQASCYNTLALGGLNVKPTLVTQIKDRDGIVRYDASPFRELTRVFPEDAAYQITHLLEGVCEPVKRSHLAGDIYYPSGRRTVSFDRPRAGKTGTTNESRSVWFCGYTPQYTCVVWIGYDDNRSLGKGTSYTGGALASPIWTDFMTAAHEGLPIKEFRVPAGVEFYDIDRGTGLAGGNYREAFIRGTEPPHEMPVFEMTDELEMLLTPPRAPAGH